MAESTQTTVTHLLRELTCGNRAALGELFPLVYDELRTLAHRQRRRPRCDFPLNTTGKDWHTTACAAHAAISR
jgi:hypothetical protein